jgi:LmbE family N-acetylglucosaminyl deacetylase
MKLLQFNKVLCLSPHPDDVEYSMAATIKKFKDTQFDILCLTNGTSTDSSTNESRILEVQSFWQNFQCANIKLINPFYKSFEDAISAEWITSIENRLPFNEYNAIFTTSNLDSHQEHIFVNNLVPALTRNKPISIIEYKSPSTLHSWSPNYFVSCDTIFNDKLISLRKSFISQIDSTYFSDDLIKLFHMDYNCFKRNYGYVEQFNIRSLYN